MKKLSFSISQQNPKPKKPIATVGDGADHNSGDSNSITYITEFVSSETLAPQNVVAATIPPLQNEWDPQRRKIADELNLRRNSGDEQSDGGDLPLRRLRFDLERLPEDRGSAEFEDMPVEGFGAALLGGYGWFEGRGIGKNTVEDVKVVEFAGRSDMAGLGFVRNGDAKVGVEVRIGLCSEI